MSWGSDARDIVEADLADSDIYTSLTLVPRTESSGTSDGGYSEDPYDSGTSRTIKSIPTTYHNLKLGYERFGNLVTGDLTFLVSSGESISKNDLVTYSSGTFRVREINPVLISGTTIAQEIVLNKDL